MSGKLLGKLKNIFFYGNVFGLIVKGILIVGSVWIWEVVGWVYWVYMIVCFICFIRESVV